MRALKREPAANRDLTIGEITPVEHPVEQRWSFSGEALREFFAQFSLQPHGQQLQTPTAKFWIFCARVLIVIMASAEAVSWGYVGSLFGVGAGSIVTGLAAAMSLFVVIWLADATFVTMDTSRAYYQRMLSPKDKADEGLFDGLVEQRKFVAGLVIRGVIVVVSLWITAPFLAQLVFRSDVIDTIRSRNGTSIASARTALAARYDEQLRPLDSALNATQSEGILEAAGQGLSGRYGRGAAVIAMEERAADLKRRIAEVGMERDSTLFAFDRALRGRVRFLGVDWGWGALLSSLAFGLAHAFGYSEGSFSLDWKILALTAIPSLLAVWLRLRTGSLLLPVVLHNFGNSIGFMA